MEGRLKWLCRQILPFLLLYLAVIFVAADGHAAINNWSRTSGPEGGRIDAVVVRSGTETVYAGTWYHGDLYKSIDGGTSWSFQTLPDATIKGISALALDPHDPTVLYAGVQSLGAYGNGIRVLRDNQGSWTSLFPQTTAFNPITSIATDPDLNPVSGKTTIYAGAYSGGVYKSTDGGATWTTRFLGSNPDSGENLSGNSVAVDPTPDVADGSRIVFVASEIGMHRSDNGGSTWRLVNSFTAQKVAMDANTVYAGDSGRIYKNSYKIANSPWVEINLGDPNAFVMSIVLDRKNPALLYVATTKGLYSILVGAIDTVSLPDPSVSNLFEANVNSNQDSVVFATKAGNAAGELVRSIAGGPWVSSTRGITNTYVYGIALDPEKPATVYAGLSYGGVYKSEDKGATFQAINENFPQGNSSAYFVTALLASTPSGTLFAGTYDGVYRRTNDSTDPAAPQWSWKHQTTPSYFGYIHALVLDPSDQTNRTIYAATEHGAFVSTDGGDNWVLTSDENLAFNDLKFAPDGTLFGSGYLHDGWWESIEAGVFKRILNNGVWTWQRVTASVDNYLETGRLVIAGTPNAYTIYVSASYPYPMAGVYKSFDRGNTWTKAPTGFSLPTIDPTNPSTLYAADGVRRSTDGGLTWSQYNQGLDTTFVVTSIFIDQTGTTLYAGTYGEGLLSITLGTTAASDTTAVNFNDVYVGRNSQQSITITNNGAENLAFSAITISGPDSADYTASGSCLSKKYLVKNETCQVTVTFAPASTGIKNAVLNVSYNGATSSSIPAIPLSGNGTLVRLALATSGNGTITCSPSTCSDSYLYGTTVTLNATAASDSEFAGWSGTGCTTAVCDVLLDGDKAITALFRQITFAVTARAVNFGGTVTPSSSQVPAGGAYTVIITPNPGYKVSSVIDNGTVIIPTPTNSYSLVVNGPHEILVSFIQTTLTGINALATDTAAYGANGNEVIYAGTKHGLSRMTSETAGWVAVTANGLTNANVSAIAIDTGTTPSTLYVATQAGIFTMPTNGTVWSLVSSENNVKSLTIDKGTTPHTLYAGTNSGIFVIKR